MADNNSAHPNRAVIEKLVRESVLRQLGLSGAGSSAQAQPQPAIAAAVEAALGRSNAAKKGSAGREAPNPLVVNVSARHCHLTQAAVEQLFGKGHKLTPMRWLYQEGQYAAKESVTLIGPRSRVISNLRILGPCRNINQVELAYTDAIALGFKIPVRQSGDIEGTPGAMLMGPNGFLSMENGIIRAAPHVHMHPDDAAFYGVEDKAYMKMRVGGPLGTTFDRIFVRVNPDFKLEVHIDTDEGNACGLQPDTPCELIR